MKLSILAAGKVGGTLSRSCVRRGHDVFFGIRRPSDVGILELLKTIGPKARAGTVGASTAESDVVVLAVPCVRPRGSLELLETPSTNS